MLLPVALMISVMTSGALPPKMIVLRLKPML